MSTQALRRFRVAFTGDFFDSDGAPRYPDIGLSVLDAAAHVEVTRFADHQPVITAEQVGTAQGLIVLTPRVAAESLRAGADLLAVGRFGVGYDTVDVPACTAADVVVFITPGAVDRPVAEATVCWML